MTEQNHKAIYIEIWPGEKPQVTLENLLANSEINAIYRALVKTNQQLKARFREQAAKQETNKEISDE